MSGPPAVEQVGRVSEADDAIRAEERRRLARELYDIVGHHLANVVLRTMGRLEGQDPDALQTVLTDVSRAAGSALVELRLLAHVLEDDPGVLPGMDGVSQLSSRLPPTAAAELWRGRLVEHGRPARYTVPAAADRLALSAQWTIARTFEVTAGPLLAGTGRRARCTTTVTVGTTAVTVQSRATLAPGGAEVGDLERELRQALRGLRERVDLSHGHLSADLHPAAGRQCTWVVTVVLPLG